MKNKLWVMIVWLNAVGGSVLAKESTVWHNGNLSLVNGTELTGDLNFNWLAQVVQYRQGPIIKAYSANQVRSFVYFDDHQNRRRKFVTVEGSVTLERRRPHILEEIVSGPLSIYREFRPVHELIRVTSLVDYGTDEAFNMDINNYTYLVYSGDELMRLDTFYNRIWPRLMQTFKTELNQYATLIRVNTTGTIGRIRLIYRYNSLAEQPLPQPMPEQKVLSVGR